MSNSARCQEIQEGIAAISVEPTEVGVVDFIVEKNRSRYNTRIQKNISITNLLKRLLRIGLRLYLSGRDVSDIETCKHKK